MQPFVLNDESQINSYGFRVPNKGIDLSRFNANPVMLADHDNSVAGVIGKWVNLRISGSKLLADPDFDLHKPVARDISSQVERGYLRGASMGISFDRSKMQTALDGIPDLVSCQKYESSICAIPSNANAVRLYVASTGQLMTDAMVKLSLQGFNLSIAMTLDQFQAMPYKEQLHFKTTNPEGYNQLFGLNRYGMKLKDGAISTGQQQSNLAQVTTLDQFHQLPYAQQLQFRDNHREAYNLLFGKDKWGMNIKV